MIDSSLNQKIMIVVGTRRVVKYYLAGDLATTFGNFLLISPNEVLVLSSSTSSFYSRNHLDDKTVEERLISRLCHISSRISIK